MLHRMVASRWATALCASLALTLGAQSASAQGPPDLLATSIEMALIEEGLVGARAIAGLLQWYAVLAAWGLAPLVLWR